MHFFAIFLCFFFLKVMSQIDTVTPIQVRLFNERFDEQKNQIDHFLTKMFADCQVLKDEQHNEADHYHKKFKTFLN